MILLPSEKNRMIAAFSFTVFLFLFIYNPLVTSIFVSLCYAGVITLMGLIAAVIKPSLTLPRLLAVKSLFVCSLMPIGLSLASLIIAGIPLYFGAETLDAQLMAIDLSLWGTLPAIYLHKLIIQNVFIYESLKAFYIGIIILIGAHLTTTRARVPFTASLCFGIILYALFPACGPAYVMPSWPEQGPALLEPPARFFRNCVPSLHTTWALIMVYNVKNLKITFLKVVTVFNLPMTILATLGLGEHYTVDLFLAIPFSIFVWNIKGLSHSLFLAATALKKKPVTGTGFN